MKISKSYTRFFNNLLLVMKKEKEEKNLFTCPIRVVTCAIGQVLVPKDTFNPSMLS